MTTVTCLLKNCRSWMDGRCRNKNIHVSGMKCLSFIERRSDRGAYTTTVRCDNKQTRYRGGCSFNDNGICAKSELTIRGDGCELLNGTTEEER